MEEHTAALVLAPNRKLHRAHARVREGNFALEGLLGFDLHGRTVGVVGTGKIGECFLRIMAGFGCTLLAHDPSPNQACVALGALRAAARTAGRKRHHQPALSPDAPDAPPHRRGGTCGHAPGRRAGQHEPGRGRRHPRGHRGAQARHPGQPGHRRVRGRSRPVLPRPLRGRHPGRRLRPFAHLPNLLVTAHQAFFTADALRAIAATTIANLDAFEERDAPLHPVSIERLA